MLQYQMGSRILFPQMMEELFLHLSAQNSALPAMVQILADFATSDGQSSIQLFDILMSLLSCLLSCVLSKVLPILGNVKDQHRPIFANGMLKDHLTPCFHDLFSLILSSIGSFILMHLLSQIIHLFLFVLSFFLAFRCWCQACWKYSVEYPLSSILDSDVM